MNFPNFYSHNEKQEFVLKNNSLIAGNETIPIIDQIPRFVPLENYASGFGEQWKKYRLTQLDSFTKVNITRQRIERCIGLELWNNLEGKLVLEAGCGAGRFTEILLEKKAKLISFDLSTAVDANIINFPISDNHRIFQGDINKIPFKGNQFDIVFCLGVIQHTPNPEQTIESLYQQVKPGGWLVIDHYTFKISHYTKSTEIFRFFIKGMEPLKGLRVTDSITNFFFPLHKLVKKIYPLQALLSRISPVHSYYFAYPQLNDELQYQWALLDTHDSLTDWYKHFRSTKQIKTFFEKLGAITIYSEYSPHGVDARCQKPSK
jgi:SAM-dependent methyltransferase